MQHDIKSTTISATDARRWGFRVMSSLDNAKASKARKYGYSKHQRKGNDMSAIKRYVSAIVGRVPPDQPGIVLYLYANGHGHGQSVEMTVPQAAALYSQLDEAIALLRAEEVRP